MASVVFESFVISVICPIEPVTEPFFQVLVKGYLASHPHSRLVFEECRMARNNWTAPPPNSLFSG